MKSLIQAVAVAAALIVPVASFAQSNAPLTRAEVRAQLTQLEQAGFKPSAGDATAYPANIQAAEAKVAATNAVSSGYGGSVGGASDAGRPAAVSKADWNAMYGRP
jgi:hypothetical protein